MSNITTSNKLLDIIGDQSVRFGLKNNDLLFKLRDLAAEFESASEYDRKKIMSHISKKTRSKLLYLSSCSAELAVNNNDASWLKVSLLAHALSGFCDYRENIRELVMIDFASKKIHIDLKLIYKNIQHVFDSSSKRRLSEFFLRDNSLNKLEVFGIEEIEENGKFRFEAVNNSV